MCAYFSKGAREKTGVHEYSDVDHGTFRDCARRGWRARVAQYRATHALDDFIRATHYTGRRVDFDFFEDVYSARDAYAVKTAVGEYAVFCAVHVRHRVSVRHPQSVSCAFASGLGMSTHTHGCVIRGCQRSFRGIETVLRDSRAARNARHQGWPISRGGQSSARRAVRGGVAQGLVFAKRRDAHRGAAASRFRASKAGKFRKQVRVSAGEHRRLFAAREKSTKGTRKSNPRRLGATLRNQPTRAGEADGYRGYQEVSNPARQQAGRRAVGSQAKDGRAAGFVNFRAENVFI